MWRQACCCSASAYWWLGNAAHELAGTAMFLLLVRAQRLQPSVGMARSRRRNAREPRALVQHRDHTGAASGDACFAGDQRPDLQCAYQGFMSAYGGFTVRQIHTLAAYWVLVIVALHLGLRWPVIMAAARSLLNISRASSRA
jgi:hypothetical protein